MSNNNGEGEIRPQSRGADGLMRMCLGPGGNVRCLSGRCPATRRRPPVPAEPIERRRVKGRAVLFTGRAGGRGNKGQGLRGTREGLTLNERGRWEPALRGARVGTLPWPSTWTA